MILKINKVKNPWPEGPALIALRRACFEKIVECLKLQMIQSALFMVYCHMGASKDSAYPVNST